jgi:hypothetical protein
MVDGDPEAVRARAEYAPATIERSDVAALAECLNPARDPDAVEAAATAIAAAVDRSPAVGLPAVPGLVELLDAEDAGIRDRVLAALVGVSRERPGAVAPAVERLVDRLEVEPDPDERAAVALVLSRVAAADPGAVAEESEGLVAHLDDGDPAVRSNVVGAVAAVAEGVPAAVVDGVPALASALAAPVAGTRVDAARALAGVAEAEADAVVDRVDELLAAASDSNPAVRAGAMEAVASVAMADPPALGGRTEALVSGLGDESDAVADAAVAALLGAAVPDPEGTARLLVGALKGSERTRSNAERTLRGIAMRNPDPVVAAIRPQLDHPDAGVRRVTTGMAAAVAQHRPTRVEGIAPELVAALEDADREVREAAAEAVAAAASECAAAFEPLASAVAESVGDGTVTPAHVRALAAVATAVPGSIDPASVPMDALLAHEDASVRAGACQVLGATADRTALSTLRERADDPVREVRVAALGGMAALAERTGATLSTDERERIAEADLGGDADER